ncbi:helix-turn-helix domain-containing protein [Saccharopolyspora pogona]|uniref:helix-turn-helix domain-containing protein n=1 Tax=Saccharopolyspora pogona TaxID=333966 RepID=UPI00168399DF|nr:helix-turn-helix transcriptional regulator [Saccharopolyspora pogona]
MPTTPTRRKKRLGQLLTRLRTEADQTLAHASDLLRVGESTVSRYETGHFRPGWATLQALLALYNASDDQRAEAAALWEDAGDRAVRLITPAGSPKPFRVFLRAEAEADSARTVDPLLVPGLLQTPAYVRAVNAKGQQFHTSSAERYVTARLSRQARLSGSAPLKLHALLDEAVLHRTVGNDEIMAEQMRHLITVMEQDNITIQVVPFSAGSYGNMCGGFTLIGYHSSDDPPAVYVDSAAGGAWVENVEDVNRFSDMFEEIASSALSSEESAKSLSARARALE